jgi:photosystem II stability/assembly factor-like uncharacterized protein
MAFTFLNGSFGWSSIDSAVYASENGGVTWSIRGACVPLSSIYFTDSLHGWGAGGKNVVRTSDGGKSWTSLSPDSSMYFRNSYASVFFVNSLVGWVLGGLSGPNELDGMVYGTTDGGTHWRMQLRVGIPLAQYRIFSDIAARNEQLVWAISEGDVYRTTDGGSNWDKIGYAENLTHLTIVDDSTLWGCGDFGLLYTSHDGGYSWQKTSRGFVTQIEDLQIADSKRLYGAGGTALLSSGDAGATWELHPVTIPGRSYVDIHTVWFADNLHGWCGTEYIGGWGSILRTLDGGSSWKVQVDSILRVFALRFDEAGVGWFGSGSRLYRSTDNGDSWNVRADLSSLGLFDINTMVFPTRDTGWVGGYEGLGQTTDAGKTWHRINPSGTGLVVEDAFFLNSRLGWVVGDYGNDSYIFNTTDGGLSWVSQQHPSEYYSRILSVWFQDRFRGWVTGSGLTSPVLVTYDGGAHWRAAEVPTTISGVRVRFLPGLGGWILCGGGIVLHWSEIPVSVGGNSGSLLTAYPSLFQNYPNPFNPTTTIRYELPHNSVVQLTVFNTLGQQIATLIRAEQEAGDHKVKFDASAFSSGVYFYRLQAGTYVETKKLLLLR